MLDSRIQWVPYMPPEGSLVELFPDGTFQIEGIEAPCGQGDRVRITSAELSADKEAGEGLPLTVTIYRGAAPQAIVLAYRDEEGSGSAWYRQVVGPRAASGGTPTSRALPKLRVRSPWLFSDAMFKAAFLVFLVWYLFFHHATFKGTPPEERYPETSYQTAPDGERELPLPPQKTVAPDGSGP